MSKFRKLIESVLFEYSAWEAHEKAIEICKQIVNDLVEIGYPKSITTPVWNSWCQMG